MTQVDLERADNIIKNKEFRKLAEHIAHLETDRIFCRHGMDHCLDVARIAVIMAADDGIDMPRDIIYAAALLHDIGRGEQYEKGTEHEAAGAELAVPILRESGYTDEETALITEAIKQHGNISVKDDRDLNGLLYRADKASRKCYMCDAISQCHKAPDKRVMGILY